MNSKTAFSALIVLVVIVLAVQANVQAQQVTPQVRQFTIYLNRFAFNGIKGGPDLVVNQGDTVRIRVISNDTIAHDWALDAPYNVKSERIRNIGNTTNVEFVANFPGTFKYYCSVVAGAFNHRERGMEGNFIVNARASTVTSTAATTAMQTTSAAGVAALTGQNFTLVILALGVLVVAALVILFKKRAQRTSKP